MRNVSQKLLIHQLRELEEHGLVHREIFREVPPRVEYSTTALGQSLRPLLRALCKWGQRHAAELNELDRLAECAVKPVRRERVQRAKRDAVLGPGKSRNN